MGSPETLAQLAKGGLNVALMLRSYNGLIGSLKRHSARQLNERRQCIDLEALRTVPEYSECKEIWIHARL